MIHFEFFKVNGGSPGVTVAYRPGHYLNRPSLFIGIAYCSPKDEFCENQEGLGIRISTGRLEKHLRRIDMADGDVFLYRRSFLNYLLAAAELADDLKRMCHIPLWLNDYVQQFRNMYYIEDWWDQWRKTSNAN